MCKKFSDIGAVKRLYTSIVPSQSAVKRLHISIVPSQLAVKRLYISIVPSQLKYGSIIWSPWQKTYVDKIERLRKRFIKYLCF